MKDISDYISNRKVEINKENQELEKLKQQLATQLNQVTVRLFELQTERKVLDNLEANFKEK